MLTRGVWVLGVAVAACSSAPVTEAEARALLDHAVSAVAADDQDALCALSFSDGVCRSVLRNVWAQAPSDPPNVVCSYAVRTSDAEGTALVLEGVDGAGNDYVSVMVVTRPGRNPKAAIPVYWMPTAPPPPAPESAPTNVGGGDTDAELDAADVCQRFAR